MHGEFSTLVRNQGRIKTIALPSGWTKETKSSGDAPDLQRWQMDGDVTFTFFYRGFPVPEEIAAAFHSALAQDPHELSRDEFDGLGGATGNCSFKKAFDLYRSFTELLNGRKVLFVEGVWFNSDSKSLQIFIDASGDGRVIQELHYVAPTEKFPSHQEEILGAIRTIEWVD